MAWLVLITHQTQAARKVLRLALPAPDGRVRLRRAARPSSGPQSYFAASFCAAISPAAPSLSASRARPKRARLILLAFGGVEIGQVKLRHRRGNRGRWLGGELVIEVDGFVAARGLVVQALPAPLGQVRKTGFQECDAAFSSVFCLFWPRSISVTPESREPSRPTGSQPKIVGHGHKSPDSPLWRGRRRSHRRPAPAELRVAPAARYKHPGPRSAQYWPPTSARLRKSNRRRPEPQSLLR